MTAPAEQQIQSLLKRDGAKLLRRGKHFVYRLSNGQKFTMFKTPSDWRCRSNELSDLRKALGILATPRRKSTAPHNKQGRQSQPFESLAPVSTAHVDQRTESNLLAISSVVHVPEPVKRTNERKAEKKAACYTYPPGILSQANVILYTQGKAAMDAFLREHRVEAVEVERKFKPQECEMPSILEMRVAAARSLKVTLEQRIDTNHTRITEANNTISSAHADNDEAGTQLKKVIDFLSTYEVVVNEAEGIEPFLSAHQKLQLAEAQHQVSRKQPIIRVKSNCPPTKILTLCQPLFDRDNRVNAQDIKDYLQREHGIVLPNKAGIYNALAYAKRTHQLEPVTEHPGEYRKVRPNGHIPAVETVPIIETAMAAAV